MGQYKYKQLFLLLILAVPFLIADMGPKPHDDYVIDYQIDPVPTLTDYWLYECNNPKCSKYQPVGDDDWGSIECTQTKCTSWTYADYLFITLGFEDGTIRQSNPVTKRFFYSKFRITVLEDELILKEVGGTPDPYQSLFLCCGISFILLIIFVVRFTTRRSKKSKSSAE